MKKIKQLPLHGVTVIDFGQQIAGPAVAMILADLGATVIHVDPPQGPMWDSPANAVLNRNKRCIRLNLKESADRKKVHSLIEHADVIIESFRPGVMKRLGVDFAELRAIRPELVTLSMPGFASNDELRRDWKATEAVVAATSGAFTDMGFNRVLMGLNPSFSPLPLGSAYATTLAASSVVMALLSREDSGRGDSIEVPIAAALMEGLSYNSIVIDQVPDRYLTMREIEIAQRKENKQTMDVSYGQLQEYLDPFYRTYECADGRYFYVVCPSHRNHAKRCLTALGIYKELLDEGLPDVADLHLPISEWDGETSIGVYPLPKKWADIISAKMKKVFLTKTSEQWGVIFGEGKIPGAPHRTTREWVNDEHTNAAGLIVEVDDPEYGLMKQPGPVMWLEECADKMLTPKPRQDTTYEEALSELTSLTDTHVTKQKVGHSVVPHNKKGWLEGVRILDLTNVIAGPHSAAFMARFGADVIKLDPVKPLYDPLIGTLFTFQTNMGKRSALIDINVDEGREALNRLIRSVDIVVINAPERQMKPLGLDDESLQKINPGVLFCRLDCLGGPRSGPKTNYIGYDDIIQANSGIMSRFGGVNTPEEHAHLGTLDVNCGFAGGLGMAVALYHKKRTGEATRARTSLSAVTNLAQVPFAFDYEGRSDFNEASGRDALGHHALSHFYQTSDGWLFLDSSERELDKLCTVNMLGKIALANSIQDYLTSLFITRPTEYWVSELRKADIAVAEPLSIETLRENYSREADGLVGINRGSYAFSIYPNHPSGHCITQVDHYSIRPTESTITSISETERYGASTVAVLKSVDYDDDQIEFMLDRKIIGNGWGREFLPS